MNDDPTYRLGQVWSYRTRPGEERSTLTVVKVTDSALGRVVHVAVEGLEISNPKAPGGVIERAQHLPFAKEAVDRSVLIMLSEGNALPPFEEGFEEWRQAYEAEKGGIFTITVAEAVALFEPREP